MGRWHSHHQRCWNGNADCDGSPVSGTLRRHRWSGAAYLGRTSGERDIKGVAILHTNGEPADRSCAAAAAAAIAAAISTAASGGCCATAGGVVVVVARCRHVRQLQAGRGRDRGRDGASRAGWSVTDATAWRPREETRDWHDRGEYTHTHTHTHTYRHTQTHTDTDTDTSRDIHADTYRHTKIHTRMPTPL